MLEDIAIQYIKLGDPAIRAISYGLVIFGAAIAGTVNRSKSELRRAPYFAFSGVLVLASAGTQFAWLSLVPAIKGGYLWSLMAVDVLGGIVIGYFFGVIAMARSRDAYGHGRNAVLAFIPIANILLFLKEPRHETSPNVIPTVPLLTGGLGVLSGFVTLAIGLTLSGLLQLQMERIARQAEQDNEIQTISIENMIGTQGLEQTLTQMAAEATLPQRIDELTTLTAIEADEMTLRYRFTVATEMDHFPAGLRQSLIVALCGNQAVRPILNAGATVESAYYRVDGYEIGIIAATRESCSE